jgi:anti-sigma B factor antagonist
MFPNNRKDAAMIYSIEQKGSVTIIHIEPKRATAEIAREFKDFLFELLDKQSVPHVVMDLQNVVFMDSFFLGALVSGLKKSRLLGGDILLTAIQGSLLPIFQLMHLDEVFKFFPTVEDALTEYPA